jgi:hypothetical protein
MTNRIYLLILSFIMACLDIVITFIGITNDYFTEANPIASHIILNYGYGILILITIIILILTYKYIPNLLIIYIIINLYGIINNSMMIG